MPPRLWTCSHCLQPKKPISPLHKHLSTATASTHSLLFGGSSSFNYPPSQPPSHRPPESRKSQLHRQYTSLLRSTPLMLLFQHNNLKSIEWMSVRRELSLALHKLEQSSPSSSPHLPLADSIKIHIIQTRIFESALLVTEYFRPDSLPPGQEIFTHALSRTAHDIVAPRKKSHPLAPLLSGPLAIISFPTVSPAHIKTTLSILSPHAPQFPAPTRRANPGYHDPVVQAALQKLLLLGARVEGKVFDTEGTRWVGGIEGGMEGLRAQLVRMLQGVAGGVVGALEGAGRSLYFTLEGRRGMLEDIEKGAEETKSGE